MAIAKDANAQVDLEYLASPDCPTEAAFVAKLRSGGGRPPREGRGGGPEVHVILAASPEGILGRLAMAEPSGETTVREISGRTCEEVADALAFVVNLALDPGRDVTRAEPVAPPPAAEAPAATAPPPASRGARLRVSGAVHAGVTGAVPAGLQVSLPLFVELAAEAPTAGRWTPSVRAGFERGFGGSVAISEGAAQFTWTIGRVDACASWPATQTIHVGPCLGVEVGEIEAVGTIAHPRSASPPWVAAGAVVRGRWAVDRSVFLELEGGAVFPLLRYTFDFDPQTLLYDVPPVGAKASAGLGVYF